MRSVASMLALLCLLLTGAPVQAAVSFAAMSPGARACCQQMQSRCEQPKLQTCCPTQGRLEQTASPADIAQAPSPTLHSTLRTAVPNIATSVATGPQGGPESPPLPLRALATTLLRI